MMCSCGETTLPAVCAGCGVRSRDTDGWALVHFARGYRNRSYEGYEWFCEDCRGRR